MSKGVFALLTGMFTFSDVARKADEACAALCVSFAASPGVLAAQQSDRPATDGEDIGHASRYALQRSCRAKIPVGPVSSAPGGAPETKARSGAAPCRRQPKGADQVRIVLGRGWRFSVRLPLRSRSAPETRSVR